MATTNVISLPAPRKAPQTQAERAKAYRDRKRAKNLNGQLDSSVVDTLPAQDIARLEDVKARPAVRAAKVLVDAEGARPRLQAKPLAVRATVDSKELDLSLGQVTHPVTVAPASRTVTSRVTPSRPSRISPASILLSAAALALGAVGITMNGWFARSLGSTEIAGWLFLAVGVAADAAALGLPSCAARFWQARQRGVALAGWLVWAATFAFALSASIGFASVNISDVTAERASRVTTAVTEAKAQLADAVTARDRECRGGVGKNCREREATVTERTNALNAAMRSVAQAADPQTEAALKAVSFLSAGTLHPTADHFALVRLLLLAFLPQVGGILLMLARTPS